VQSQVSNPGSGPANLLGNDLLFFDTPNDAAGKVSFGITRKAGQGGGSGSGPIVWVKFVSLVSTPDMTQISWSCTNVTANDPGGNAIILTPVGTTTTISTGCIVWPGDSNDDGQVNAADVLPIGLYFGSTGPARPGASLTWTGQSVPCWTPEKAGYADANGNGSVGAEDVLAIGLNWAKSHSMPAKERPPDFVHSLAVANTIKPAVTWVSGDSFKVEVQVSEVTDLFGIAFDLVYSTPQAGIEALTVAPDPFMGTDLVFFSQMDNAAKKVNVGISRKAGQGGVSGSGTIVSVYFQGNTTAPQGTTVDFQLQSITANDSSGNPIALSAETASFVTHVESGSIAENPIPESYALSQNYPNPFNPETTIQYQMPEKSEVKLAIFSLLGQHVATLVDGVQPAGVHSVQWDGKDHAGRDVASGVYLYRLETSEFVQVKKLVLLR